MLLHLDFLILKISKPSIKNPLKRTILIKKARSLLNQYSQAGNMDSLQAAISKAELAIPTTSEDQYD